MKNNHFIKFVLLLGLVVLSGCISFVYKTEDIRHSMSESESKLEQRANELGADYAKRLEAYNQLISGVKNPKLFPYYEMKKELNVMGANVEKVKAETAAYHQRRLNVEKGLGSDAKLPSSHPGIAAAKAFRDEQTEIVERVKASQANYESAAKHYNEITRKGGIVNIKTAELVTQFETRQTEVKKQIQALRDKLVEVKQRNIASVDAKASQRTELLSQISIKLDEVENKSTLFFQMKDRIVKEANGRAEYLTGPQLPSYGSVEELNALAKDINEKTNEINAIITQYHKIDESK